MEAALHGVRSVALSQYFGPATAGGDAFAAARAHGAALLRKLLATPRAWPPGSYAVFYNVNFPAVPAGGGARHPRHLPGPPPRADLRRAAAHRRRTAAPSSG